MTDEKKATVVAITGHREEKIVDKQWVEERLVDAFRITQAGEIIQGMANGVDLMSARLAFKYGIPFTSARPWITHAPKTSDERDYNNALRYAKEVIVVTDVDSYCGAWLYQARNEWMVDHSTGVVIAVWDGSRGGTYNCVKYAMLQGCKIWRIDESSRTVGWV